MLDFHTPAVSQRPRCCCRPLREMFSALDTQWSRIISPTYNLSDVELVDEKRETYGELVSTQMFGFRPVLVRWIKGSAGLCGCMDNRVGFRG